MNAFRKSVKLLAEFLNSFDDPEIRILWRSLRVSCGDFENHVKFCVRLKGYVIPITLVFPQFEIEFTDRYGVEIFRLSRERFPLLVVNHKV